MCVCVSVEITGERSSEVQREEFGPDIIGLARYNDRVAVAAETSEP